MNSSTPYISKSAYEISDAPQVSSSKPTKDAKPDLWAKILQDVAKRDDKQDSTVLLLGDKGAGKRSLVRSIN